MPKYDAEILNLAEQILGQSEPKSGQPPADPPPDEPTPTPQAPEAAVEASPKHTDEPGGKQIKTAEELARMIRPILPNIRNAPGMDSK